VQLPQFDGSDCEGWAKDFLRWLRVTGLTEAPTAVKMDWIIQSCNPKVRHLLERITESQPTWEQFVDSIHNLFPKLETDWSIRDRLRHLQGLPKDPSPSQIEVLLLEMESLLARMQPNAFSPQDKLLLLMEKLHPEAWRALRERREWRPRTEDYQSLKELIREKARDDFIEKHLFHRNKEPTKKVFAVEASQSSTQVSSPMDQDGG